MNLVDRATWAAAVISWLVVSVRSLLRGLGLGLGGYEERRLRASGPALRVQEQIWGS